MNKSFTLHRYRRRIDDYCRVWKITEMALFGAVLTPDFGPDSEIGVLVTFEPGACWTPMDLTTMQNELGAIFNHTVALTDREEALKSENPITRNDSLSHHRVIYASY
jgi:predicted nucleotidyltransferase